MVNRKNHNLSITALPTILVRGCIQDHEGIARFLQGEGQQSGFVRRFTDDYLQPGTAHHAELIKEIGAGEWNLHQALLILRTIVESGDDPDTLRPFLVEACRGGAEVETLLRRLMPVVRMPVVRKQFARQKKETKKTPEFEAAIEELLRATYAKSTADELQDELQGLRKLVPIMWTNAMTLSFVALWWRDSVEGIPGNFVPSIYCPNLKTALYVRSALGGQRVCLGCGQFFAPDRPNQLYHANRRCGDRHRMRRYREERERKRRSKSKSKSKRKKTQGGNNVGI